MSSTKRATCLSECPTNLPHRSHTSKLLFQNLKNQTAAQPVWSIVYQEGHSRDVVVHHVGSTSFDKILHRQLLHFCCPQQTTKMFSRLILIEGLMRFKEAKNSRVDKVCTFSSLQWYYTKCVCHTNHTMRG